MHSPSAAGRRPFRPTVAEAVVPWSGCRRARAWAAWALVRACPLYEVSASARLEAERAPHPLQAPIDGQLCRELSDTRPPGGGEDVLVGSRPGRKATKREAETRLTALEREGAGPERRAGLLESAAEERGASLAALNAARAGCPSPRRRRAISAPSRRLKKLSDEGAHRPPRRDARSIRSASARTAAAASARRPVDLLGRTKA